MSRLQLLYEYIEDGETIYDSIALSHIYISCDTLGEERECLLKIASEIGSSSNIENTLTPFINGDKNKKPQYPHICIQKRSGNRYVLIGYRAINGTDSSISFEEFMQLFYGEVGELEWDITQILL